jgi:hypothetical protein
VGAVAVDLADLAAAVDRAAEADQAEADQAEAAEVIDRGFSPLTRVRRTRLYFEASVRLTLTVRRR